jgi:hypothetical protein
VLQGLFLPMKYLGLPLGALFKANYIWDGIIKEIEHWTRMYLSKGWRVTMIKSILSNLPTSCLFSPPSWCCQSHREVEKLQRVFLWGWHW